MVTDGRIVDEEQVVAAGGRVDGPQPGNLLEWVADWVPRSTGACGSWPADYGGDFQCLGAGTTGEPSALLRGGDFLIGSSAGVYAVDGRSPVGADVNAGFRGAR